MRKECRCHETLERFEHRYGKKKTRTNKGKEKSTKEIQNTLIRCPGSIVPAERALARLAES